MIFYDTETCGFHGPTILIQYAIDDGPVILHNVWHEPICKTLGLIEMFMNHEDGICGFNLSFDHFHLCQTYTTLQLLQQKVGSKATPRLYINEYAYCEPDARLGVCLKPVKSLDLMLHARKGPYQSTMDRNKIVVRRIPTVISEEVREVLDKEVKLKDIYFNGSKKRWRIQDIKDEDDSIVPHLKNLVLEFKPSSALKALAIDALGLDVSKFEDIRPNVQPVERSYAPFALAVGEKGDWKGAWPDYGVIKKHIEHWTENEHAIKYATDDVVYTRALYYYFSALASGVSESEARKYALGDTFNRYAIDAGDVDSDLACMVGAVRWRGYAIDEDRIKNILEEQETLLAKSKYNFNSHSVAKLYLVDKLSDMEKTIIADNMGRITTKGLILEEVARWKKSDVCENCNGMEIDCEYCEDGMVKTYIPHPAAVRAKEILEYRKANLRIGMMKKLLQAGRFHAQFKVIGTLSSRMAGGDAEGGSEGGSLNPQGINHAKEIRKCFNLGDSTLSLCAGDFSGFELSIMDAVYPDKKLHAELNSDKKIHALWGSRYFFPYMSYEEVVDTDGLVGDKDKYTRSKQGVFAISYFGEAYTLTNRVGIEEKVAEEAYNQIQKDYPEFSEGRRSVIDQFCSMKQPDGVGTAVEWHEPAEYIESLLGFKRYYTLENNICRTLFRLAEKPPESWKKIRGRIVRRDREQTVVGACRSALFGAAFGIQGANMRAAGNHRIQSTGGEICKRLQHKLWGIQPTGICDWKIQPMNVHDEVLAPTAPELVPKTTEIVDEFVKEYRSIIPLLKISWMTNLNNWSEK